MKAKAGSYAKVTPPTLFDCSHRQRLFDLLDAKQTLPVIWIAGPPGSGKTTLVKSYIEHLDQPCLWYQVDAGDADRLKALQRAARQSAVERFATAKVVPEYEALYREVLGTTNA